MARLRGFTGIRRKARARQARKIAGEEKATITDRETAITEQLGSQVDELKRKRRSRGGIRSLFDEGEDDAVGGVSLLGF